MFHHLLILCSCPDANIAKQIGDALVEERLAACVNRLGALRSSYDWGGQLQDEPEVLLLIKTLATSYEAIEMRIKALHPAALPEIIGIPIVAGSGPFLDWVRTQSTAVE